VLRTLEKPAAGANVSGAAGHRSPAGETRRPRTQLLVHLSWWLRSGGCNISVRPGARTAGV